jgi:tRNA-(ms[2]io[6]A)-hydroxylase
VASEARHFGLYWVLAEKGFGREATVARLQVLAAAEVLALAGDLVSIDLVRMHSVGVELGNG